MIALRYVDEGDGKAGSGMAATSIKIKYEKMKETNEQPMEYE